MKQTVEEAAAECRQAIAESMGPYAQYHFIDECPNHGLSCDTLVEESFIAGAEWQSKQSPWHLTSKELPDIGRHVVNEDWFDFKAKDESDLKRIIKKYPFKIWAYVDDLMPHDFDQILEANKDVLQRIMEKGD